MTHKLLMSKAPAAGGPFDPEFVVLDTQRSYGTTFASDVTIPASVSPGDTILVLASGRGNQVFAPADPTGWTIVGEASGSPPIGIYRRTAGASESVYSFTRRNLNFGSLVNSDWETNALCVIASGFGSAAFASNAVVSSTGPVASPASTAVDGDTLWHIWAVANGTGLSFEWLTVPAPAVDLDPPVETDGTSKSMLQVATEDITVTGATTGRNRSYQSTLPDSRTAVHRGGVLVITPG